MKRFVAISILIASFSGLAVSSPQGKSQGKGRGEPNKTETKETKDAGGGGVVFGGAEIRIIKDWFSSPTNLKGLPPGLAKKHNGCLPPGQAKKLYRGQRWESGYGSYYGYNQIPYDLRRRYDLNSRYRYYYNDGYLYQVDPRTMLVQQVISALLR